MIGDRETPEEDVRGFMLSTVKKSITRLWYSGNISPRHGEVGSSTLPSRTRAIVSAQRETGDPSRPAVKPGGVRNLRTPNQLDVPNKPSTPLGAEAAGNRDYDSLGRMPSPSGWKPPEEGEKGYSGEGSDPGAAKR